MAKNAKSKIVKEEQGRSEMEEEDIKNQFAHLDEGELPEGFVSAKAERSNLWYRPDSGNVVYGQLLGRHVITAKSPKDKDKAYYQIRLAQACSASTREEETNEYIEVLCKPGDVLNVTEWWELKGLTNALEQARVEGCGIMVYIRPTHKEPIGGGQSLWHFDTGWKKETASI